MTDLFSPAAPEVVNAYWDRRPDWCRSDQSRENAATLIGAASEIDGGEMLEIGSSAGEGAAALLHGSRENGARLHGIDVATHVYYDKTKPIGAVVAEAFPEYANRYQLHTESTSKRARTFEQRFNLVHIDGAHSHPWAVLDLLNVMGVVENGTLILLDDAKYTAPLSQAAYYMAHELSEFGKLSGGHFAFRYPGPTLDFITRLERIITMPWQAPIPYGELMGLFEYLTHSIGPQAAAKLAGAFLVAFDRYEQHATIYQPLSQRLWRNEIELRKAKRGGTPYGQHE